MKDEETLPRNGMEICTLAKQKKNLEISFLTSTLCYFLGSKLSEQVTLEAFDFFLYLCIYLSTMSQREENFRKENKHYSWNIT